MVNSSFLNDDTTIAAIATAAGVGGVGVIRISGPDAFPIAQQITQVKTIESHRATCLLYTSPSPRDRTRSRMPSSA